MNYAAGSEKMLAYRRQVAGIRQEMRTTLAAITSLPVLHSWCPVPILPSRSRRWPSAVDGNFAW